MVEVCLETLQKLMTMSEQILITAAGIENAWAQAYTEVIHKGDGITLHVIINLDDGDFEALTPLRRKIDSTLIASGKATISTVANTIFPNSVWNRKVDRSFLYDRYEKNVLPKIKGENPRGTYFQRMTAYLPLGANKPINQLEHVIETWTKYNNHRHTALQISVFDPTRDHQHSIRLGFPCLHQVCLTPHGANGSDGLSLTAFYASQHILTKGLGNYLGLVRLGQFVAHYLNLKLIRVSCIAAKASIGEKYSKEFKTDLLNACSKMNEAHEV